MPKRGRPPKPDTLKLLQGTARAHRMNHDQPQFSIELDNTPPEHLTKLQCKVWNEIVPQLQEKKLYTTIDMANITALCVHLAKFWELEEILRTRLYSATGNWLTCNNDAYKLYMIQSMSWNMAQKIMTKYGMSPVDRQAMKIEKENGGIGDILPPKPHIAQ